MTSRLSTGSSSIWAIVAANLWELAGVLVFGWDAFYLAFVYCVENVVIGLFNVLRIALARKDRPSILETIIAVPFFIAHFGLFTLFHGAMVIGLWKEFGGGPRPAHRDLTTLLDGIDAAATWPVAVAAGLLLASHGWSFWVNTIRRREYLNISVKDQMTAPYGRVVVMHVTVIGGAILVVLTGLPPLLAAVLVPLKVALDLKSHRKERARLAGSGA